MSGGCALLDLDRVKKIASTASIDLDDVAQGRHNQSTAYDLSGVEVCHFAYFAKGIILLRNENSSLTMSLSLYPISLEYCLCCRVQGEA